MGSCMGTPKDEIPPIKTEVDGNTCCTDDNCCSGCDSFASKCCIINVTKKEHKNKQKRDFQPPKPKNDSTD